MHASDKTHDNKASDSAFSQKERDDLIFSHALDEDKLIPSLRECSKVTKENDMNCAGGMQETQKLFDDVRNE